MSRKINIAVVHFSVSERSDQGREEVFRQFSEAAGRLDGTGVDLVVTCEGMSSLGQRVEQAECVDSPGPMLELYGDFARRNHCVVAGALKLAENGNVYNALVFLNPDGSPAGRYRKTFPTPRELTAGISAGRGAEVVETAAGRLGGVICYDLNFKDLCDGYRNLKPDVLCFSSMFHGGDMQRQWARESRAFFAGAIKDTNSVILDPLGNELARCNYYTRTAWARVNLDRFMMHLDRNLVKFPAIRRKYGNDVRIDISPELCFAVLYSESAERSAWDIAREFELNSLDDLMSESRPGSNA